MNAKLEQVYARLKQVSENRKGDDGEPVGLLYQDITRVLKREGISDFEIIESIRECLIAHAFIGVTILNTVGGPQKMEVPVVETKDLAEALYYTLLVQETLTRVEVPPEIEEDLEDAEDEND